MLKVNNMCTLQQISLLQLFHWGNRNIRVTLASILGPAAHSPHRDILIHSKGANPEAKPAFNLSLIVEASNLQASVRDIVLLSPRL